MLKPSEHSPYVGGLLWGEIFAEAGLPEGVLNIVTHARGEAGPIGEELTENPAVRVINFTGSTRPAASLAEAAGRNLKRVVLELGGSNPLVVLEDADLDYAVDAAAFGAFLHQGQICMSARRIIVEQPIADGFVERLVEKTKALKAGDPKEQDTIIGPLITEDAVADGEEACRRRRRAGREGARRRRRGRVGLPGDAPERRPAGLRVRAGGDLRPGRFDRGGGQSGGGGRAGERDQLRPLGRDHHVGSDRGLALAQQIDAGIVHVNDQPVGDEPQMPFGGVKESGFGRFGGSAVINEFTELRWVTVSPTHPFPF